MPVEIRELIIKTSVDTSEGGRAVDTDLLDDLKKEVLTECMDKVKMLLKQQNGR